LADAIIGMPLDAAPDGGDTIRLTQRTMACDFSVIMNPGPMDRVMMASDALDHVKQLEDQLTVYNSESEVSRLNADAANNAVRVEQRLFALIQVAKRIGDATNGAFDLTAGPLIAMWRRCREASRIPSADEINECLEIIGMHHLRLNESDSSIEFDKPGVEINFGAIGKGYALDRAAGCLADHGLDAFLLHGGHSSILARGQHLEADGWPVGIGNPLFTDRRLGTILLRNQAMSTSGSNIQYFRYQGKRFGHILDPRSGWPIEGILSATVVADSAAAADALSTAFYVMGIEAATEYCALHSEIGAILVPQPSNDRRVRPLVLGLAAGQIFWDPEQVLIDHQ
jgi:thiamine biosynthesis lipoprotein